MAYIIRSDKSVTLSTDKRNVFLIMIDKREKLSSFDALRVYSCFAVMSYHAYITLWGYSGLSVFFVMSGFLCVYNYFGDGKTSKLGLGESLSFSLKKIKKLYPLHLVMLVYPLITQLYGLLNGLLPAWRFFTKLAANVLLVHAWIPVNEYYFSFNVPSWYLSAMIFLYLMLPFVLRCMEKYRSRRTALVTALAIFLLQIVSSVAAEKIYIAAARPDPVELAGFYQWFVQVFPIYRLGDFVIGGNLAYFFLHEEKREISPIRGTVAELSAIILTVLAQFVYIRVPKNTTCIFLVSSAALVYAFALNSGYITSVLTNKVIKYLAALSADIYLIHFPVIMLAGVISTCLPLDAGLQRAFFICFVFGFTYGVAILVKSIRRKNRRFT